MKTCQKCQKRFPSVIVIDGKRRYLQRRKFCLDCSPFGGGNRRNLCTTPVKGSPEYKARGLKRYQKRKAKINKKVRELGGNKCKSCGYNKCSAALEFHHRDPKTKKFQLSTAYRRPWEDVLDEVAKCDLLCSNCHGEEEDRKTYATERHAISMRKMRILHKQKIINHMGGCCCICGYTNSNRNLVTHHLDPNTKSFNVAARSVNLDYPVEELVTEMKKCVLVCSNCHREIHAGLIQNPSETTFEDKSPSFVEEWEEYKNRNKKTPVHCSECKKEMNQAVKTGLCMSCYHFTRRKVERPSHEVLVAELAQSNYSAMGRKYGVSDNAIRKWLR